MSAVGYLIHRPEQAVDMIADLLEDSLLDLGYVGRYDESKLPFYPAVVVSPGERSKELHATQTFAVDIRTYLYVYHCRMDASHVSRSREDLELCGAIEAVLETDYEWHDTAGNERIIFGYIENEAPGIFQPRAAKGASVIGTRLTWRGTSQRRF